MRHWSGYANTEEFIKAAIAEPHPLDEEFERWHDLFVLPVLEVTFHKPTFDNDRWLPERYK